MDLAMFILDEGLHTVARQSARVHRISKAF